MAKRKKAAVFAVGSEALKPNAQKPGGFGSYEHTVHNRPGPHHTDDPGGKKHHTEAGHASPKRTAKTRRKRNIGRS